MNQLDPILVGEVIAQFRIKKKLSQEVLSGLSDIGRTHLSAIERGTRTPTLQTFYKICSALNVPMSVVIKELERQMEESE